MLLRCPRLFILYVTESTRHLCEMQMAEMNLANSGCQECTERWLRQNVWGKDLASWGSPGRRSCQGASEHHQRRAAAPSLRSLATQEPRFPERESPTGPARSLDHPLARQQLDIGIRSPPELQVAVRESLEKIQGTVAGKRGRWEQLMSTTWIL